jgi:hypothetical protein
MKTSTIKIYKTHNSVSCIERGFNNITKKNIMPKKFNPPNNWREREESVANAKPFQATPPPVNPPTLFFRK